MSNKKPWKKAERDHIKNLEAKKSGELWDGFVRRHEKRLKADADRLAREETSEERAITSAERAELLSSQTDAERRLWLEENKPEKYFKILRTLQTAQLITEEKGDPTVYYEGDIRITMVLKDRPGQNLRLKNFLDLSTPELELLLDRLDEFPGLRFIYYPWRNETKLVWDDPESQDLHSP